MKVKFTNCCFVDDVYLCLNEKITKEHNTRDYLIKIVADCLLECYGVLTIENFVQIFNNFTKDKNFNVCVSECEEVFSKLNKQSDAIIFEDNQIRRKEIGEFVASFIRNCQEKNNNNFWIPKTFNEYFNTQNENSVSAEILNFIIERKISKIRGNHYLSKLLFDLKIEGKSKSSSEYFKSFKLKLSKKEKNLLSGMIEELKKEVRYWCFCGFKIPELKNDFAFSNLNSYLLDEYKKVALNSEGISELGDFVLCVANFYGVIKICDLFDLYKKYYLDNCSKDDFMVLIGIAEMLEKGFVVYEDVVTSKAVKEEDIDELLYCQSEKPLKILPLEELMNYKNEFYFCKTKHTNKFYNFLIKNLHLNCFVAESLMRKMIYKIRTDIYLSNNLFDVFNEYNINISEVDLYKVADIFGEINNNTPMWCNNGFTPEEIFGLLR